MINKSLIKIIKFWINKSLWLYVDIYVCGYFHALLSIIEHFTISHFYGKDWIQNLRETQCEIKISYLKAENWPLYRNYKTCSRLDKSKVGRFDKLKLN